MPPSRKGHAQARIERVIESADRAASRRMASLSLLGDPEPVASEAVHALRDFESTAGRRLFQNIRIMASHPGVAVLIVGESGSGKTQVARAIHDLSPRSIESFHKRDLACVPRDFAASELFGHLKGSYTGSEGERLGAFALAHRGSLFLDELSKADLNVQGMLLTAIEKGEIQPMGSERTFVVDVRLIAATNVALETKVKSGDFLDDLAARLEAFVVSVPPLRDRRKDIPKLVRTIIKQAAHDLRLPRTPVASPDLMELLVRYRWPHNLRELNGSVTRIVMEAGGASELRAHHIPTNLPVHAASGKRRNHTDTERQAGILAAGGNISRAARLLGCHRTTLHRHFPPAARGRSGSGGPTVDASGATQRAAGKRQSGPSQPPPVA